jgi:hypothetical protein
VEYPLIVGVVAALLGGFLPLTELAELAVCGKPWGESATADVSAKVAFALSSWFSP